MYVCVYFLQGGSRKYDNSFKTIQPKVSTKYSSTNFSNNDFPPPNIFHQTFSTNIFHTTLNMFDQLFSSKKFHQNFHHKISNNNFPPQIFQQQFSTTNIPTIIFQPKFSNHNFPPTHILYFWILDSSVKYLILYLSEPNCKYPCFFPGK